jgi:hypothetical protein
MEHNYREIVPRKQSMHSIVQTVVPDSLQLFSVEKIDRLTKADVATASLWFSGNLLAFQESWGSESGW